MLKKINKIFYYFFQYSFAMLDQLYFLLSGLKYKLVDKLEIDNFNKFWTNGFIEFKSKDKKFLKQLSTKVQALDSSNLVKPQDLLKKNFLNKIFSNTVITQYQDELLSEYSFVKDPINLFPELKQFIKDEIIPFSEKIMKSNVSIENTQIYKTEAKAGNLTNGVFHVDGDIKKAFKLMIYLTDCNADNGPLIIKSQENKELTLTGKAGDGIAFAHSNFTHKGSKPLEGYRWVMNLKIFPKIFASTIELKGSMYLNADRRKLLFKKM